VKKKGRRGAHGARHTSNLGPTRNLGRGFGAAGAGLRTKSDHCPHHLSCFIHQSMRAHTQTHTDLPAHTHTHTRTHTLSLTNTQTHTYMCARTRSAGSRPPPWPPTTNATACMMWSTLPARRCRTWAASKPRASCTRALTMCKVCGQSCWVVRCAIVAPPAAAAAAAAATMCQQCGSQEAEHVALGTSQAIVYIPANPDSDAGAIHAHWRHVLHLTPCAALRQCAA